jgi:REP element-mobilizing transposase RayT
MPRKARIDAPGCLHHIIARGIERQKIFRDDKDRDTFVDRLGRVLAMTDTPCFAWALIPNHFHLLLKTGNIPIAGIMQRVLTGYAGDFNRRHRRTGRLFQNRYKSILCQEDAYLMELVRYIHLNPVRARLVEDLAALARYPYSGHSAIMGKCNAEWQDSDTVLRHFAAGKRSARSRYLKFMEKGISQGRRRDLIGGGLVRSAGGWAVVKQLRKLKIHLKGDERILGDSDFVESVLARAEEEMERKYRIRAKGYDLDFLVQKAASEFALSFSEIIRPSKQPLRVHARSVVAYRAVRELGMSEVAVGKKLGIGQSAVSRAVKRGEELAQDRDILMGEEKNA